MVESGVAVPGMTRLVVYVVYAKDGVVDEFVLHALNALRETADHLTVVVNGSVDPVGRERLAGACDTYLERPNEGFDIWGYKFAIDHHGDRLADFDEVVLTNDTWFGPIHPFSDVLSRMEKDNVDFWGMTEHAAEDATEGISEGVPRHLQSFWIAARRSLVVSATWKRYWAELPAMPGYWDAVSLHELKFTDTMQQGGFTSGAAFPAADYPPGNTSILLPDLLLADGCPLLKRRVFHHYPPYLLRHATIGRWILRDAARGGYPLDLIYSNLARTTSPRVLNVDAGLLEVLVPGRELEPGGHLASPLLVIVAADDADTLKANVSALPVGRGELDLVLAVPDRLVARAAEMLDGLPIAPRSAAVRASTESNGVRRVLAAMREHPPAGLVLAVTSDLPSRSRPDHNGVAYARRHAFDSLVGDGDQLARVVELFRREQNLGIVLPPLPQIGSSVIPSAPHDELRPLRELHGIEVPLDDGRQLAPLGGVFIARPDALASLIDDAGPFEDVVLRDSLVAAAAARGYHHRTVLSGPQAAVSHPSLEWKVDELGASTWGYPLDQIQFLQRVSWRGRPSLGSVAARYLSLNHPKMAGRMLALRGRLRRVR